MQLEELEKQHELKRAEQAQKIAVLPKYGMEIFCNAFCTEQKICHGNGKPYCCEYELD